MKGIQVFPRRYGFFPYIFLIYFTMPIYYMGMVTGIKAILGYALILLFIVSYRQLYWFPSLKKYNAWLAIQLSLIVILSLFYSPYNLFMGFFPANFIGWYENKQQFHRALVAFFLVLVGTATVSALQGSLHDIIYFIPFLAVMLFSPFGIRSMNKRMELEKELDEAHEQIKQLIKREERVRIARDLHDTLGHTLSLITLQSQLVQRLVEKQPERAKAEAKQIEKTSRTALSQVRELVSNMQAVTISEELVHMEQIVLAAGMEFYREGSLEGVEIPPLQQNILGMCLREAGTNLVKHSQATKCHVQLQPLKGYVTITIQDNGIGMSEQKNVGSGLKGMKERLALIEGELVIQSSELGTTLAITVPIIAKQEEIAL